MLRKRQRARPRTESEEKKDNLSPVTSLPQNTDK